MLRKLRRTVAKVDDSLSAIVLDEICSRAFGMVNTSRTVQRLTDTRVGRSHCI